MLTVEQINSIHNLQAERWSVRRIARQLQMDTRTVKKYLQAPVQTPVSRPRTSKLDNFESAIDELLEQDPQASAAVIAQRLKPLGFTGGRTILQNYVRDHRPAPTVPRAFVRMEPNPGDRFEVDWGHFDVLDYSGDKRKLYAFALVECHSRMMYVEFTHSQSFETFVRCHIHAFHALGGCSREIWFDNLATAVAEHDGRLVRFNPRFFAFAKEYGFFPRACNRAAGWEKGRLSGPALVIFARTSGRCASSPICTMSIVKCSNGSKKWPISGFIEKRANVRWIAFSRPRSVRYRHSRRITATVSKRWFTKISESPSMAIAIALRRNWWAKN